MRSRTMQYLGMKGGVETREQRARRIRRVKEQNRAEGERRKREVESRYLREYDEYCSYFRMDHSGINMGAWGAESIQGDMYSNSRNGLRMLSPNEWLRETGKIYDLRREYNEIDAETREKDAEADESY